MFGLQEATTCDNHVWENLSTTTSLVDESFIYGREHEKEEIVHFLLADTDCDKQISIISIVGLGGMGKTALAQLVFNDHRIKEQFEIKAWVSVSQSIGLVSLAQSILKSFQSSAADSQDLEILQHQLQQRLTGKRCLLILDDVWSRNKNMLECLLLPFSHGSSGSKIIVTTRDKEVASIMLSTRLLHLKQLQENDSWSLFVKHAFRGRNVVEYPDLELIGKKIVEKCGGLPLALKTLGSILRTKSSESEWVKILETDLCRNDDNNINPLLRLSYLNLPSNVKRCFAYCSIFPKGYEFDKGGLIKLWMAEGLLKCWGRDNSEEELGNEFFHNLVSISFFQQSVMPTWAGKYYFIIHNIVNELAKSVSGESRLRIESDNVQDIPERTRHIWCCLDLKDGDRKLEHISKIEGLHSLTVEAHGYVDQRFKISTNVQQKLFSRLKYLRMLSFSSCNLLDLADEIGKLKLMCYLDLSYTEIACLPNSICMLYNLQTLLLQDCFKLTELPSDFYKLVNLHHLNLEGTSIKNMPTKIGGLNNLEMLTDFVVGEQHGIDIKQLGKLNQLRGKLRISGLENVIDPADVVAANLQRKEYLEELSMSYDQWREIDGSVTEADVVLEALKPNKHLMKLTIKDYRDNSFPNWLGCHHLLNLVSLELLGCKFPSHMPPLGQFPFLKKLTISGCDGIEIIGTKFYGYNSSNVRFRSFETLRFEHMSEWKEWLCLDGFPLLQDLCIKHCPKLRSALPQNLPSLQKLEIIDCQELEASIPRADNISWHSSSLPFALHLFTNLNSLVLYDSPWLESFLGWQFPSNLCSLGIERCPKLMASREEWGLFQVNSLEQFRVSDDFEIFESFPEECLLPSSINSLELINCSNLRIINYKGLLHLASLEYLYIEDCPCLESLPEEGLPNSLSTLSIN
ncbi:hypothetical protein TSUD_120270 [Trifolium subterraneum]|uniref:Uncharacterized protein n=1 Tax=Trifolium subterraneum TaxID=3900 RepID=A0A2Z6M6H7_TRISU|nr:hypothetical protein TSUD_120270 [Trifolium subterraneum]